MVNENIDKDQSVFSELEMEIFATGKWNGGEFEEKDLNEIVDSYKAIGEQVKPYMKLGHNDEQELAKKSGFFKDGKPALGWIESLTKQGNKLVAKFKDVPKVVADLVNKKAYKRVSCELFQNYARGEQKYPWVLKAVALLGADTPAVTTLQDVVALYTESTDEYVTIDFSENFEEETMESLDPQEIVDVEKKEDPEEEAGEKEIKEGCEKKMSGEQEVKVEDLVKKFEEEKASLEKQLSDQKSVVEKYGELAKMFEGIEDMKKAVLDFQDKQKEVAEKQKLYDETLAKVRKDEVKQFVSSLIAENRILPFQQLMVEEILFSIPEGGKELVFSQAELFGLKEKMSLSETVRTLLKSNPDMGMLKEFTSQDKITSDPEVLRAELEKKYMDENPGTDYGAAQCAVSKARPELYDIKK